MRRVAADDKGERGCVPASTPTAHQIRLTSSTAELPADQPGRRARSGDWRDDPTIGRPSGASLFSQVLAVNTLIIVATVFTASVAARLDLNTSEGLKSFLIASVAMLVTALLNGLVLRRRFRPTSRSSPLRWTRRRKRRRKRRSRR